MPVPKYSSIENFKVNVMEVHAIHEMWDEEPDFLTTGEYTHAGYMGRLNGEEFESYITKVLREHGISFVSQPKYRDPWSGLNRLCDFSFRDNDGKKWYLEAKCFSDLGSHLQKVPEHLDTAIAGGYGKNFLIVFCVDPIKTPHQQQKWRGLRSRWNQKIIEASRKGITIRMIHVDEFIPLMFPNGVTSLLDV